MLRNGTIKILEDVFTIVNQIFSAMKSRREKYEICYTGLRKNFI